MPALVLTLADLYARVPANIIRGYFDDSNNGVLTEEASTVQDVLMAAEGELWSRLLGAFPGSSPEDPNSPVRRLLANDATLRMHAAWIACELACERRVEFTNAEGWGAYKAQYDRAITYIANTAKGLLRSPGEVQAGPNGTIGGSHSSDPNPDAALFVFAPDRNAPSGRGGF